MKKPALVILAAGSSSRMGEPKQLLPFQENTLLGTVINNCKDVDFHSRYCVIGANASKIEASHQDLGITFIQNDHFESGLSSSIKKAVEIIQEKEPTISGIFFLLGDQPYITETHIKYYLNLYSAHPQKIITTAYKKGSGVPALFPTQYFTNLLLLEGDAGAKELIETVTDKIQVHLPKEALTDIDTKEEYQNSLKQTNT